MAPRRTKSNSTPKNARSVANNYESPSENPKALMLDDVTCKICLDIMIEPVSLPCHHELCFPCFENCVQKSNLCCPLCRKRISVWCRQATKNNTIVNKLLWERIKAEFPAQVALRCEGKDNEQDLDDYFPAVPMHQFAEPGEILKEFEAEQQRIAQEEEKRRLEEEKASANLLAQLVLQQDAEEIKAAELEQMRLRDEALAQSLASETESRTLRQSTSIQTPSSNRKRPRKAFDSAGLTPTAKRPVTTTPISKRPITKFFSSRPSSNVNDESMDSAPGSSASFLVPENNSTPSGSISLSQTPRSCSGASSASIEKEITKRLLFRPINAAPLTPPKLSPDSGVIVKPQVVPGTARNLSTFPDDEDVNHNEPSSPNKEGTLADELRAMERDWLRRKKEQEEADLELARQLQQQLDKETKSPVNRSKGSDDEYKLRSKGKKDSGKQATIVDAFQRPLRKSSLPNDSQ